MPDIKQQQIVDWLEEAEHKWELTKEPKARFNIAFEYPREGGGYMHAASHKPDRISIIRALLVSEEHRQALTELGTDGFATFRFGLLRDLLRIGDVTYNLTGETENSMDGIILQREIFVDDLTRSTFFSVVRCVFNTALLVTIHVRRAVGQMP